MIDSSVDNRSEQPRVAGANPESNAPALNSAGEAIVSLCTLATRFEAVFSPRYRTARTLVFCCALATVIVVGVWRGSRRDKLSERPWLTVPDSALSFCDDVWMQEALQWKLPVENHTNEIVAVKNVTSTCGCSTITPESLTIPPGECGEIQLTFDLTRRRREFLDKPSFPFAATIFGEAKKGDIARKLAWRLEGNVRCALFVSPQMIDFGDRLSFGVPYGSEFAAIKAHYPLRELRAECDGLDIQVSLEDDSADKSAKVFRLTPLRTLPVGRFKRRVSLFATTPDGEQLPPHSVIVRGELLPKIQAHPRTVDFGLMALGERVTAAVVLSAADDTEFEIVQIDAPASIHMEPPIIAAARSHNFTVTYDADAVGSFRGEAVVHVRRGGGIGKLVVIPLQSYVTSAVDARTLGVDYN